MIRSFRDLYDDLSGRKRRAENKYANELIKRKLGNKGSSMLHLVTNIITFFIAVVIVVSLLKLFF